MTDLSIEDYACAFATDPDATWDVPPATVRLDDDSIDRLAAAIADRLARTPR